MGPEIDDLFWDEDEDESWDEGEDDDASPETDEPKTDEPPGITVNRAQRLAREGTRD